MADSKGLLDLLMVEVRAGSRRDLFAMLSTRGALGVRSVSDA
jgi:hypothetical protein